MQNIMDINDQNLQEQDLQLLLNRLDISTLVRTQQAIEQLNTTYINEDSDSQQESDNIDLNDQYNQNSSNQLFGQLNQPEFVNNQFLQISQMVRSQTLDRSSQSQGIQPFSSFQSQKLSIQPKRYKQETRKDKLDRYLIKKSNRWSPKIKKFVYECRSIVALNRTRVKGQFQKNTISTQCSKKQKNKQSKKLCNKQSKPGTNTLEQIINEIINEVFNPN